MAVVFFYFCVGYCTVPSSHANGHILPVKDRGHNIGIGRKITILCNYLNYWISNRNTTSLTLQCVAENTWSESIPTCTRKLCKLYKSITFELIFV